MKQVIRKFLVHLKAINLVCLYLHHLDHLSPELKATLINEKKSVMKFRKKFLVSKISPMIKPKSWRRPFQSRHDGLCLWCGMSWIDRYLDICSQLSFKFLYRKDLGVDTTDNCDIVDTVQLEQLYDKFYVLYCCKVSVFFEVFTSLILSGIDPYNRKVVIIVNGLGIHDIYTYEVFLQKPDL